MARRIQLGGAVLLLWLALMPGIGAQEPRFADLLIQPNATGAKARGCCVLRGDEIRGEGVTIRQLIAAACRRHAFDRRDVIGPSWIDDERYDFTAKVAGGPAYDSTGFPGRTFAMLRAYVGHKIPGSIDRSSILQSQLGMRLERVTAPIEVLIVERAAKPQ